MKPTWKLTERQKEEIAQRWAEGESSVSIAADYPITAGGIRHMVRQRNKRKLWCSIIFSGRRGRRWNASRNAGSLPGCS